MTDVFSSEKRSAVMQRIRSADTKPEILVRRLLFASGFRFHLQVKNLPGKPDIVLPKWKTVVFVNGCFWHQHPGCRRATIPASRKDYWLPKLKRNVERDAEEQDALIESGWRVLVVWECACRKDFRDDLQRLMERFIKGGCRFGWIELVQNEDSDSVVLADAAQIEASPGGNPVNACPAS